MFIKIVTERWIDEKDFDSWVIAVNTGGMPLDGAKLKNDGKWEKVDDMGFTKAHSVYSLIKPEEVNFLKDKVDKK